MSFGFFIIDESSDVKDLVWERVFRVVLGISFDFDFDIDDLAAGGGMLWYVSMVSSGKVSINRGLLGGGNILLVSPTILLVSDSDGLLFDGRNTSSEIVLSNADDGFLFGGGGKCDWTSCLNDN